MSGKINGRFFKEDKRWYLSKSLIHEDGVFAARNIISGEMIDTAIRFERITSGQVDVYSVTPKELLNSPHT